MKLLFTSFWLAFFVTRISMACTAFCYISDSRAILAKNLDWPVDAGLILVNRRGIQKSSFAATDRTVNWTSKFSSITFNQFGIEFPLGGMNEKGLVVEELNMPSVETTPDPFRQTLNEFQLVQYMLDNFSEVGEVEEAMDHFQTVPLLGSLHYLIMDRQGNSLIMEFDGTRFRFYDPGETGVPVLSNNLYPESIRYLKKFQGFGGDLGVHHRSGSNERFVSAAHLLAEVKTTEPVKHSFEILHTVAQSDTRWSIVYDATHLNIYLKFHKSPDIEEINLDKILALKSQTTLGADVSDTHLNNPYSFGSVSAEQNMELIIHVVNQLSQATDLDSRRAHFDRLICYSNTYIIDKTN